MAETLDEIAVQFHGFLQMMKNKENNIYGFQPLIGRPMATRPKEKMLVVCEECLKKLTIGERAEFARVLEIMSGYLLDQGGAHPQAPMPS